MYVDFIPVLVTSYTYLHLNDTKFNLFKKMC